MKNAKKQAVMAQVKKFASAGERKPPMPRPQVVESKKAFNKKRSRREGRALCQCY